MTIIGQKEEVKQVVLYLVGQAEPIVVLPESAATPVIEETEMTEDEKNLAALDAAMRELEELKKQRAAVPEAKEEAKLRNDVPKNKRRVKADPNRRYVRLGELKTWGRVPQQQADIAKIICDFPQGVEFGEAELFDRLEARRDDFESLRKSEQHVSYLFCYYRGLKNDGKHAGFIGRSFLRQVG